MITDFLIQEVDGCCEKLDDLENKFIKEKDEDGKRNLQNSIFHYEGRLKQLRRCLDYTVEMSGAGRI